MTTARSRPPRATTAAERKTSFGEWPIETLMLNVPPAGWQWINNPSPEQLVKAYLNNPWVHHKYLRCCSAVASVEWELKARKEGGNGRTEYAPLPETYPLWRLLQDPNPYLTEYDFRFLSELYVRATGEVFWRLARNRLGVPEQIFVYPRMWVRPLRDPRTHQIVAYRLPFEEVPVPVRDMLWLHNPDPLNPYLLGIGDMLSLATEIETFEYASEADKNFFLRDATPAGALVTPAVITEDEQKRIKEQWWRKYGSFRNYGEVPILWGGMKFEKFRETKKEMDFVEGQKYLRDTIIAGVPKHVLGISEDVNRAVAEASEYTFAKWEVLPRAKWTEDQVNKHLCPQFDPRVRLFFRNPVPQDNDRLLAAAQDQFAGETFTVDERRAMVGKATGTDWAPLGGAHGSSFSVLISREQTPDPLAPTGEPGAPGDVPEDQPPEDAPEEPAPSLTPPPTSPVEPLPGFPAPIGYSRGKAEEGDCNWVTINHNPVCMTDGHDHEGAAGHMAGAPKVHESFGQRALEYGPGAWQAPVGKELGRTDFTFLLDTKTGQFYKSSSGEHMQHSRIVDLVGREPASEDQMLHGRSMADGSLQLSGLSLPGRGGALSDDELYKWGARFARDVLPHVGKPDMPVHVFGVERQEAVIPLRDLPKYSNRSARGGAAKASGRLEAVGVAVRDERGFVMIMPSKLDIAMGWPRAGAAFRPDNQSGRDAAIPTAHQVKVSLRDLLRALGDFGEEFDLLRRALAPQYERTMRARWAQAVEEVGAEVGFDVSDPAVARFLRVEAGKRIRGIAKTTLGDVRAAMAAGAEAGEGIPQIAKRIAAAFDAAKGYRATLIARTEVMTASNQAAVAAYGAAGVDRHEWLTAPDYDADQDDGECDVDGEVVEIGDPFSNGYDMPPAHPNCRCATAPVVGGKTLYEGSARLKRVDASGRFHEPLERGFRAAFQKATQEYQNRVNRALRALGE